MTVIRNLPSLEKLDDVKIEPEERQDALRKGKILIHPEDSDAENVAAVSLSQSPTRAIVRRKCLHNRFSSRMISVYCSF